MRSFVKGLLDGMVDGRVGTAVYVPTFLGSRECWRIGVKLEESSMTIGLDLLCCVSAKSQFQNSWLCLDGILTLTTGVSSGKLRISSHTPLNILTSGKGHSQRPAYSGVQVTRSAFG